MDGGDGEGETEFDRADVPRWGVGVEGEVGAELVNAAFGGAPFGFGWWVGGIEVVYDVGEVVEFDATQSEDPDGAR